MISIFIWKNYIYIERNEWWLKEIFRLPLFSNCYKTSYNGKSTPEYLFLAYGYSWNSLALSHHPPAFSSRFCHSFDTRQRRKDSPLVRLRGGFIKLRVNNIRHFQPIRLQQKWVSTRRNLCLGSPTRLKLVSRYRWLIHAFDCFIRTDYQLSLTSILESAEKASFILFSDASAI